MGSRETTFRSVLAYAIGGGWGAENVVEGSVPVAVVRGTDFSSLNAGVYSQVPRRFEKKSKVERRTLKKGDIILEISGGSPSRGQTTGRSYYVDERTLAGIGGRVIPASFCRLVRVDESKIVPKFAYYWLQDMYLSKRAAEYENQSTGISNFQFESFLDREATELPPLDYQRRVVALLGSLEERIFTLRQASNRLEAIAQALFKSWFVDFDPVRAKAEGRELEGMDAATSALFPSEFNESELGRLPLGWTAQRLDSIAGNVREQAKPDLLDPQTPYTGLEHMPRNSIALMEKGEAAGLASGKFWYTPCDILFGRLRPYFHKVGVAAERGICSTDILVVRSREPDWFGYCVGQFSSDALIAYATQVSNGARMPRVGWKDLAAYQVPIPPVKVAAAYDRLVRPLVMRIHQNIAHARTLSLLRDTLLPRLISGKLRLPDAEVEIEAAFT